LRGVKIFDNFFDPAGGLDMIARYGHILVGITWIGLLYFFNFVQVPSYAQLDAGARNQAFDKLTWRALWWFRYAALATFLFGILLLGIYSSADKANFGGHNYLATSRGTAILTGMLFGITMFLNVWGVIWRNQQVVIGSVRQQLAGGQADPAQPDAAKRAARASRANTFFSIPMLWFMVFAAHYAAVFGATTTNGGIYWVIVLVLWAFVEASALGFVGGLDNAFNKLVFDDHKKTIIYGFVYWAVIFFVGWEILLKNVL
jgi:uncharacterized membrane protein